MVANPGANQPFRGGLPGLGNHFGADYRGWVGGRRTLGDMVDEQQRYDVDKTDEEWRSELSEDEFAVLRRAGTERAFTGEYTDTETVGTYHCRACDAELFTSSTKFHSGCGWPSFYQPITDTIEYIEDRSYGMLRTEVRCARCGSHLGHVFPDGYGTPTGDRYCINSVSLRLTPKPD